MCPAEELQVFFGAEAEVEGREPFLFCICFFFLYTSFVCVFVAEADRVGPVECEMLHSADKTRSLLILLDVETTSEDAGRDVLLG